MCNSTITEDPTTPQVCRYTIPCEITSLSLLIFKNHSWQDATDKVSSYMFMS